MRRLFALLIAGTLALGACSPDEDSTPTGDSTAGGDSTVPAAAAPVGPPPAGIVVDGLPSEPISIGILVAPIEGEGSEYRALAEGAAIAAYRLNLAGADVRLVTALDDGTSTGAAGAMDSLVASGVAGIVVASAGPHVIAAVEGASASGTPVVMAYDQPPASAAGAWSIAPSPAALDEQVGEALAATGASRPYYVNSSVSVLSGIGAAGLSELGDPAAIAETIVAGVEELRFDSVVIDAPAAQQAQMVAAIQTLLEDRQVPIILAPSALTPAFAAELEALGTAGAWLISVGTNTDDPAALQSGGAGDAVAAFLAALRLATGDATCRNVYDDDTCAATAGSADIASHDAVISLVQAVAAAGSTNASEVGSALSSLALTEDAGLAGAPLDFSSSAALADDEVTVLDGTPQDPGLRPSGIDHGIFWFADSD